jgi:hypothetical protein
MNTADRRQDVDIHSVLEPYRAKELPIGAIAGSYETMRVQNCNNFRLKDKKYFDVLIPSMALNSLQVAYRVPADRSSTQESPSPL